ncbi:MAG TPA: hypothetical protein VMS37_22350, partial [Verrucomicrobiae bacterium]|nr:hypothetical protein [Verrucomicrobiae bacterium]
GSLWEAFFGNAAVARRMATSALQLSRGRVVLYGAAFVLALAGDTPRSLELGNEMAKRFPEDTSVQLSYLPALRARIELDRGDAAKAIGILEAAVPNELGEPRAAIHANFGALYPVYVRGEAYLAARQASAAAAEFQKVLDHRGIVNSDPIGALARLEIGRAFALSGDKSKARAAYQDFLGLWKDADPAIPVLKQAKAEFAKL